MAFFEEKNNFVAHVMDSLRYGAKGLAYNFIFRRKTTIRQMRVMVSLHMSQEYEKVRLKTQEFNNRALNVPSSCQSD